MGAPRLWLVRHAQVQVAPGTCYGQRDLPADPAASQACAQALADALPAGVPVHHSTLQRCELLAQQLQALRPDLASKPDPRLRELDFGQWEGRLWTGLPRAELDTWAQQLAHYPPGGGEPLHAMLARVAAVLAESRQAALRAEQDVVWISHAGVARCVQWLLGARAHEAPCAAQWPVAAPAMGAWALYALPPL